VTTEELDALLSVETGAASEEDTGAAEYPASEEAAEETAAADEYVAGEEAAAEDDAWTADEYAAGEDAAEDATDDGEDAAEDAAEVAAEVAASEPTLLEPVGVSPARTQPVFAVNAAGQVTFLKLTLGLSAPSNQPKRKSHPG